MKLELKHLSGYLPYSLKMVVGNVRANVAYMSTKKIAIIRQNGIGDVEKYNWEDCRKNRVKPILHDIDSITEECESELEDLGVDKVEHAFRYWYKDCEYMYCGVDELPYKAVECLLKHHIDIHDLIENDLAININDLK